VSSSTEKESIVTEFHELAKLLRMNPLSSELGKVKAVEEEWHPTSVTPLPVQIGSLSTGYFYAWTGHIHIRIQ